MVPGTLTSASIALNTITGGNIAPASITGGNIAQATIAGANIAAGTIQDGNLAPGTITSASIATGTITGGNIALNTVSANNLNPTIGVWISGSGNIYRNSGYVGVGTTTPACPLEVDSTVNTATGAKSAWYYLFSSTAETEVVNGSESPPVSIKAAGYLLANGFISFSDRRIKDVIGQSDPRNDLAAIERLKVTDYRMKDRVGQGDKARKGFIAQEVQAVIPDAVNKSREYIPDIYAASDQLAFDARAQTLSVTLNKAHDLKKGDKVRLIAEEGTLEREVLATPDEKTFVVGSFSQAPARIFVFGKQVDDFLAVDYNRIFSTGIGAIQELAARVEKLEARQAQMAELEQKVSRLGTLEQEVAELKQTVAQLSAANKTARQAAAGEEHRLIAGNASR
jgi:hypothetical protein